MTDPRQRLHRQGQPLAASALPMRPAPLAAALGRADVSLDEWRRGTALSIAGATVVVVGLLSRQPVAVVAMAMAVSLWPTINLFRRRHRRSSRLVEAVPDLLDMVARDLRSGGSPAVALRDAARRLDGPLAQRAEATAIAITLGSGRSHAFAQFAHAGDPAELVSARVALEFVHDHGSGAAALVATADAVRASARLQAEVVALTAQARLSAQVLVALPIGFVVLSALSGIDRATALFTTDLGRLCLAGGLALNLVGAVWLGLQTRVVGDR